MRHRVGEVLVPLSHLIQLKLKGSPCDARLHKTSFLQLDICTDAQSRQNYHHHKSTLRYRVRNRDIRCRTDTYPRAVTPELLEPRFPLTKTTSTAA